MSRAVVVRYRVKADALAQNVELVRAVYDEPAATRPEGLRDSTYRVDERTFVHVAVIEGPGNPLDDVTAFRMFSAGISEPCQEGPQAAGGELVGSFPAG
ncbi:MAG TPA: hypothetical protein VLX59_08735 [Acidimicrobiales bacterium]|nr:hypothetical protein [Acidimicrobiales bacterium]